MTIMTRLLALILSLTLLITILISVSCEGTATPTINTTTITTISTTTETTKTESIGDLSSFYPSYIIITPETTTITAGDSLLYTVMGYDDKGNGLEVTRDCEFSIPKGAGGTWILNEYISENPGIWQVAARYNNPTAGFQFWRSEATLIVKEQTETPQTS